MTTTYPCHSPYMIVRSGGFCLGWYYHFIVIINIATIAAAASLHLLTVFLLSFGRNIFRFLYFTKYAEQMGTHFAKERGVYERVLQR